MAEEILHYTLREGVACLAMDDGKANVLSHASIAALHQALDRAESEARAVLWTGRPDRFCAGFDLDVMRSGVEPMRKLVAAGGELYLRMLGHPLPLVVGCTGHALAAGALVLLAADLRVGVRGDYKLGLNETAIGMTLPWFAVELARERLSKRHFTRSTSLAQIHSPESAVDAGFLDEVVEPDALARTALARAEALAALDPRAVAATKARNNEALVERLREAMARELSGD